MFVSDMTYLTCGRRVKVNNVWLAFKRVISLTFIAVIVDVRFPHGQQTGPGDHKVPS